MIVLHCVRLMLFLPWSDESALSKAFTTSLESLVVVCFRLLLLFLGLSVQSRLIGHYRSVRLSPFSYMFFSLYSFIIIIWRQYLNSGAGGIGGAFVHRRHHSSARPKLSGWWSNREDNRFEMRHGVDLAAGADAYRLCNPPPALVSLHQAGLEVRRNTQ